MGADVLDPFLSLIQGEFKLFLANHREGYFSNLVCD